MNECIAKLANQSGFDVDSTGKFGNYSEMHRLEKFAELIVDEVYDYILNATFDDEPWPDRAEVKKYFGGLNNEHL